ncbi:MAG: O-antigen ligase family protein [Mesorhizobium sp.]|nr:O-antigen ligase family protein [Mesorhizobium sp.]MBL8576300.1 O-antigen ligase family protein [Mesorhizobium sp.]
MSALTSELPPAAVNAKLVALISSAAVVVGILLSGFVLNEPAPYEIYMAALIAIWALFGLRISRSVAPLLVLLVLFNIGGMISITQMSDLYETPMYIAVSLFLALTAVFFAAILEARPAFYSLIFRSWIVAAVVTSMLGIIGYFGLLPGSEIFTKYDRAAGAFQDPNVFGPFLALPGIYLLYLVLTGNPLKMMLYAVPLLVVLAGIFLSFSRGAWGLFAFAAILLTATLFLQSNSGKFRLRIALMSIAAVAVLVVAFIAILNIPGVADMLTERAQLTQDYDSARLGRFARHIIGFQVAAENPLGIGPLMFGLTYGEDTHNIWLKALLDYGWLGFVCWLIMVGWTIGGGFRILFRKRPWQPYLLCAYFVFLGHVALGTVIDTDHWRHFYLLIGLIWGAMALEKRHQLALKRAESRSSDRMVGVPGFDTIAS